MNTLPPQDTSCVSPIHILDTVHPHLNQKNCVQLAIIFAEHILPILERRFPQDKTFRSLIKQGKNYLSSGCSFPFELESVSYAAPYADFINTSIYSKIDYPSMLRAVAEYCVAMVYAHTSYMTGGSDQVVDQAANTEINWQTDMVHNFFGKQSYLQSPNDTQLSVP